MTECDGIDVERDFWGRTMLEHLTTSRFHTPENFEPRPVGKRYADLARHKADMSGNAEDVREGRTMSGKSAEQQARDLLERYGAEDAQSWSAGELVELADVIADANAYRRLKART